MGNYTIGRGQVFLSEFVPGTFSPKGFRAVGNAPTFNLASQPQMLAHYSSTGGVRVKDASVMLQVDTTGTLTLDEVDFENLALFFLGESATVAQTSATTQTYTITDAVKGMLYQVGATPTNPVGFRSLTAVGVAVGATPKTLNTDYTIDLVRGLITILPGGTIADGDDVVVTYSRSAISMRQTISGRTEFEGALLYVANNPEGDNIDYLLPYVKVAPNGDFPLISDEWQQMPCTVEVLTAPGLEAVYASGQPFTV